MITTWLGEVKPGEKMMRVKIEVRETEIKRTVVVPVRLTLDSFSDVIREAVGWDGSHGWMFYQGKDLRWPQGQEEDEDKPTCSWPYDTTWYQSPYNHRLGEVLPTKGKRLYYCYDKGDNWEHLITRMGDPAEGATVGCEKTAGVWGRDDVGGACGLESLFKALRRWDKDCTDAECREGEFSGDKRFWFGWGKKAVREKFLAGPTVDEVSAKLQALFTNMPEEERLRFEKLFKE